MPHTVFSLEEVAAYLHIQIDDVRELVKCGEIPFETAHNQTVFRRGDVDAWASQRILGLRDKHLQSYHARSSARVHDLSDDHDIIAELLKPAYIEPACPSKTKPSLIRFAVEQADQTDLLLDPPELLASLQTREKMASTALSGGVAMLHPRHHDPYLFDDSFITLSRTRQPIPFGSPDGQTSHLFFLVCCQDDRIHLHVLARLCMICHQTDLIFLLNEAESAAAMYEAVVQCEQDVIKDLLKR